MERGLFWRAAGLQALVVGALFLLLAAVLPGAFFREYGLVIGPLSWMACALLTGRLLGLPWPRVVVAAVTAGALAAIVGGVIDHLLGIVVAVLAFGALGAAHGLPSRRAGRAGVR